MGQKTKRTQMQLMRVCRLRRYDQSATDIAFSADVKYGGWHEQRADKPDGLHVKIFKV
jgi:hypothetical protein